MEHNVNLITTLALGFGLALIFGLIAEKLKLPALLGYIAAGVTLSPLTPGATVDMSIASQLSEVGIMLLMFGVGLHFSVQDLMQVRRIALPGAALQMVFTTFVGTLITHFFFGWSWSTAVTTGLAMSVTSTVVLLKTLEARGMMSTLNGRIAVGWLVVEDMITVISLVLLPPIAALLLNTAGTNDHHVAVVPQKKQQVVSPLDNLIITEQVIDSSNFLFEKQESSSKRIDVPQVSTPSSSSSSPVKPATIAVPKESSSFLFTVFVTLVKVATFIGIMLIAGKRFFPWLLYLVSQTGSRELFTLSVVATAIGIAYWASVMFQVSFALGAFIAGMVMRESEFSHRAAEESMPLRDAFAVLFFVSVGLLLDPVVLLQHPIKLTVMVFLIVVGKSFAGSMLGLLFKYPAKISLGLGASLGQIGEFSFIFAGVAVSLGLMEKDAFSLLVAASIISIGLNPFWIKFAEPLSAILIKKSVYARSLESVPQTVVDSIPNLPEQIDLKTISQHVVLVGHGTVGKHIAHDLEGQKVQVVVIEQNRDRVIALMEAGRLAIHGDGCEVTILDKANVTAASAMIIATQDVVSVKEMVSQARLINDQIEIIVKTSSEDEWRLLNDDLSQFENVKVLWSEYEMARNIVTNLISILKGNTKSLASSEPLIYTNNRAPQRSIEPVALSADIGQPAS